MKNNGKFLSVGYGNVGRAVPERCMPLGLQPSEYIIRSGGIYKVKNGSQELVSKESEFWNDEKVLDGVRIVFLSIPSYEDGRRAYRIISGLLGKGIPVVTSEKGALANFYEELAPNIKNIGISATVGGGTGMMSYLCERVNLRTNQIHTVLNGTLNFIMHGISEGGTAGQVIEQAVTLGFAEPGAKNHLDVLNGEIIGDVPKKTSILWNTVIRPDLAQNSFLQASELLSKKNMKMGQDELNRLISEAGSRRYIVSIIKSPEEIPEDDILAGFRKDLPGGWVIIGGFRKIGDNPLFKPLRLPGPGNGAVIAAGPNESDGVYHTSGPGAGPGPTAAAMVQDARRILSL
jgi:homoserine dehydrogenase